MKIGISIYSAVLLLLIGGCQGPSSMKDERRDSEPTDTLRSSGFDPLGLPGDREIVPVSNPKQLDVGGTGEGGPGNRSAETLRDGGGAINDSLTSQVYRVQLFTTKLYADARQAKRVADEIFDHPVFLDYEVPYYKVRVGSFVDKQKAEEYQRRAKAAGYTDAWVVMVSVNIRETLPVYENLSVPQQADSVKGDDEGNADDN